MKKRVCGALAALTLAAGIGLGVAAPANAESDPALVSCSFAGLYSDDDLSDLIYYYTRNTPLTVTGGDEDAWAVTVEKGNRPTGWMSKECVVFLA